MPSSKILFLTPRWPYPPLSGGKLFVLQAAEALRDHDLTLLSLCASREEMESDPNDGVFSRIHKVYLPRMRSYWNVLSSLHQDTPLQLSYYRSAQFRAKYEELLPLNDAVFAHLIRSGQYVIGSPQKIPSVLFMADAISLAYQRAASLSGISTLWRFLSRAELGKLSRYERSCPGEFDRVWLHTEVDRRFLELKQESVRIIPMGVDLEEFPFNPAPSGNVVAFIGNMSFSLNMDACLNFINDILPGLRAQAEIRFRVIGACSAAARRKLEKHSGVEVTGAVRRIADAVDGVFCGVCPVRAGAGIQNKILNYLALGLPCVTSEVGLEGLSAVDGRDLFVYGTADHAVQLIMNLHKDSLLRSEIAKHGRRLVEKEHDWKEIRRSIRRDFSELLASKSPLPR